jgi:cysteine desulfurase
MKHYLDYNATAPLRPEAIAVMQELLRLPLNASSVHAAGRQAKGIIEDARRVIAECIGAFANEVVFTASGTEANNWALHASEGGPVIVSAIEHSSVLKPARAASHFSLIPVTSDGVIDIGQLERILPRQGPFLVSLMLANNETGVIQPMREAADIVHARGGLLHCDAVQAFGKIPVDFTALGCDLMTISGHKMGGPVGAAALVIRNGLSLAPMITGGGQEQNRRAGTENIAAIAGFAKATMLMDYSHMKNLRGWLDAMEAQVTSASGGRAVIFGAGALRLPTTCCIAVPGISSETQLIRFDLEGIATSAGSACSSGRIEPSHVLRAMGAGAEIAGSALRISGGWRTTKEDIKAVAAQWKLLLNGHKAA